MRELASNTYSLGLKKKRDRMLGPLATMLLWGAVAVNSSIPVMAGDCAYDITSPSHRIASWYTNHSRYLLYVRDAQPLYDAGVSVSADHDLRDNQIVVYSRLDCSVLGRVDIPEDRRVPDEIFREEDSPWPVDIGENTLEIQYALMSTDSRGLDFYRAVFVADAPPRITPVTRTTVAELQALVKVLRQKTPSASGEADAGNKADPTADSSLARSESPTAGQSSENWYWMLIAGVGVLGIAIIARRKE